MSRSTDPGHFFQTDASEATRERKAAKSTNKNGSPIKLQSKILALIADPHSSNTIYVAESAGCIRKVDIKTRDTKTVYRGPVAPVTCIAIGGKNVDIIFAGCWDKDIWSWNRESKELAQKFKGHSDFIKAVVCARLGGKDILISGGADSKIIVWDISTGQKIHTLRDKLDNMMAIQSLLIDPIASGPTKLVLLSSSSDPTIRQWTISLDSWAQVLPDGDKATEKGSAAIIAVHETSVYAMTFVPGAEEAEDSDLWTASADGTAKCLSRTRNWDVEETLEHGDYVRAVALSSDYVITAGRNEDIKVWRRDTGKLWHVFEGHYEEVTGLLVFGEGSSEEKVVSVSIDGTVRVWSLEKTSLEKAIKERVDQQKGVLKEEIAKPAKKSLLTAEEEAELADLMSDSE